MSGIQMDGVLTKADRSGTSQSQPSSDLEDEPREARQRPPAADADGVHLEWKCVSDLSVFSQVTDLLTIAAVACQLLCPSS
jgi:hypothetical protein